MTTFIALYTAGQHLTTQLQFSKLQDIHIIPISQIKKLRLRIKCQKTHSCKGEELVPSKLSLCEAKCPQMRTDSLFCPTTPTLGQVVPT